MKPSVGRIVHYHIADTPQLTPKPVAAIITEVNNETHVSLAIFAPSGVLFARAVPYDEDGKLDTWRAPPYVPQT
jgi:hypothetical protein